jgi:flagellar biosynthesis/type III secretory pathway protein FliH
VVKISSCQKQGYQDGLNEGKLKGWNQGYETGCTQGKQIGNEVLTLALILRGITLQVSQNFQ